MLVMTRIAGVRKVEFTINASNPVDWGLITQKAELHSGMHLRKLDAFTSSLRGKASMTVFWKWEVISKSYQCTLLIINC